MSERKEGFYWIMHDAFDGWQAGQWEDGAWMLAGINKSLADEQMEVIGPRIPSPDEPWQCVPETPDWSMLSADGCSKHHDGQPCLHHDNRRRIWKAMLRAAPHPSDPTYE